MRRVSLEIEADNPVLLALDRMLEDASSRQALADKLAIVLGDAVRQFGMSEAVCAVTLLTHSGLLVEIEAWATRAVEAEVKALEAEQKAAVAQAEAKAQIELAQAEADLKIALAARDRARGESV